MIRINAERAMKIYLILLFLQLNDLNLSEKRGISATNKYEDITVTANRKNIFSANMAHEWLSDDTKTNEQINSALAGVGKPINESVCRVSILNLANRNAEKAAMINADVAMNHPQVNMSIDRPSFDTAGNSKVYMIVAGATPKLTTSANESSSLPITEYALSQRAANPSKKSKTAATRIK